MSSNAPKHAILVGIQTQLDDGFEASMEELSQLVQTLGWQVAGTLTQKRNEPKVTTVLGRGKLDELKRFVEELREAPEAPEVVVVFDLALSPIQFHHVAHLLDAEVLDRRGVILEIFHRRARSREAQLQVELARLQYVALLMRHRRGKKMDQQGGGIGAKGLGEAAHKLEKRQLRDRKAQLRRELDRLAATREQRCQKRKDAHGVALVGYTNAGKSTWMKALTEAASVEAKDQLFATLDTTVRCLSSRPRILLSDTVGFIKDLPHDLVASFRSTLEEARQASLLLHVVDASAPQIDGQLKVTEEILGTLEARHIPCMLLFNKADKLDAETRETLELLYPDALFVSARDPRDVERVEQAITSHFAGEVVEETLFVPYASHHLLSEIYEAMEVLSIQHKEEGSQLMVRCFQAAYDWIEGCLLQTRPLGEAA